MKYFPFQKSFSTRLMPIAFTRRRTSPFAGTGKGTSSS
jgi:hypothetical protein